MNKDEIINTTTLKNKVREILAEGSSNEYNKAISDRYRSLIAKSPILCVGDRVVHMSDLVNTIRYNLSPNFNKEYALKDLEVIIDYINQVGDFDTESDFRRKLYREEI